MTVHIPSRQEVELYSRLIGGQVHGRGSGTKTGDLLDLAVYIAGKIDAAGGFTPAPPYDCNLYTSFGFDTMVSGFVQTVTGNIGEIPSRGFSIGSGQTAPYQSNPAIANRQRAYVLTTGTSSSTYSYVQLMDPGTTAPRSVYPGAFQGGKWRSGMIAKTRWTFEWVGYLSSIAAGYRHGLGFVGANTAPQAARMGVPTFPQVSLVFYPAVDDQWNLLTSTGSANTLTPVGAVVAATTLYELKLEWDSVLGARATVNGTASAWITANIPSQSNCGSGAQYGAYPYWGSDNPGNTGSAVSGYVEQMWLYETGSGDPGHAA